MVLFYSSYRPIASVVLLKSSCDASINDDLTIQESQDVHCIIDSLRSIARKGVTVHPFKERSPSTDGIENRTEKLTSIPNRVVLSLNRTRPREMDLKHDDSFVGDATIVADFGGIVKPDSEDFEERTKSQDRQRWTQ